jgi:phosphoribosylglycinamide formyltransferase 1
MQFVVLISGRGSNLAAIIDAVSSYQITGSLAGVISDNPEAPGLAYAKAHNIPTYVVEQKSYMNTARFEANLAQIINQLDTNLIVLAGFMKILSTNFVRNYLGKIINIHPSLLPKYKGLNTHERALEAGDTQHGASVHFVTADLDSGPVIAYSEVPISATDNPSSLESKVLLKEHILYPQVIQWFASGDIIYSLQGVFLNNQLLTSAGIKL